METIIRCNILSKSWRCYLGRLERGHDEDSLPIPRRHIRTNKELERVKSFG